MVAVPQLEVFSAAHICFCFMCARAYCGFVYDWACLALVVYNTVCLDSTVACLFCLFGGCVFSVCVVIEYFVVVCLDDGFDVLCAAV